MAEFQAGEVVVPVVPSARTFIADLKRQILPGAFKAGEDVGKEINRGIAGQLQAITLNVQADTTAALAGLDAVRREAQRVASESAQIRVGADTGAAQAALQALLAEMARVNGQRAEVDVDADIAAALARLAAIEAEVSRVDGRTAHARVDVDVAGALASIALVAGALAAIPLAATAALGAGALGGIFAAAGAGIAGVAAVAGPSLGRINDALKEQEKNAVGAASGLTAAAGATRNLAIESAQAQIKQLQAANAADTLSAAQDRVKDASAGVTQAKQRLSSAVAAAAQAQVSAAERVGRAEKSLGDAQRSALKTQTDLNKARQQAAKDLQSIAQQARGNALDQREAALDVVDAEEELAAARKKGDPEDIERAEIAYERVKLRVEELASAQQNLAEEQAKGIEGNDRVVAAKEAVEAANEQVIAQERELAQAYAESGKAGEGAANRVADARKAVKDAEDRVDDAKKAVEQVKRQQKIAALQETIRKEQAKDAAKQQADAAKRAAAAAAAASAKSGAKTAELSPAEAIAAKQIKAFKDAYEKFQKDLGPAVLPVITGGLDVIAKLFVPLTPLIKGSADALVGLEKAAATALGGKFWTGFFKDLSDAAPTAITGLGKAFGGIATGIAGVIKAFLPFVPTIVGGITKAASAFATWGKNLGSSEGFKAFIGYVRANWPTIQSLFVSLVSAVKNVITALAPLGSAALTTISAIFRVISSLNPAVIRGIAVAIGAIVVAVKLWSIAQKILNVVLAANPIGLIVAAVGLLIGAVVAAYHAFPEFKAVVDTAIKGAATVITWAWENIIKPALEALQAFISNVLAPAFTWLWNNVIVPAWTGISTAVQIAWTTIIQPALQALWNFIKTVLAPAVLWLWENVIKPAFAKAGEAIKATWVTIIQPALKALWSFITETLAPKILWLWENVVKPTFAKMGEGIDYAWNKVIKPAFTFLAEFITQTIPNAFEKGVGLIGTAWAKIQDLAKKPINFVIETVYNNGIVKLWNTVADALGLDLKLSTIPQLARGGIYPGYTPGKDIGLAAVSGGEAIMRPEWTRAVGSDYVNSANAAARSGGVSGAAKFMGGFASGGIIGDLLAAGVKAGAETFLNPLLDQATAAMGGSKWAQLITGIPKKMIADVVAFLSQKDAETGGLSGGKAVAYARAQVGKPYEWGATGPGSFDCSGLVMRALQAAGVEGVPRVSQDQMSWVEPVSKPQAGMLGFPNPGHVWLYSAPNRIIEAPQTGLNVREVAARTAQVIGRPPVYDSGGYLPPGESLVYNGTGRPEPVLTDQQWSAVQQGGASRGGDGSMVTVQEMNVTPEQSPYAIANELKFIMGTNLRARG